MKEAIKRRNTQQPTGTEHLLNISHIGLMAGVQKEHIQLKGWMKRKCRTERYSHGHRIERIPEWPLTTEKHAQCSQS